MWSTFFILYTFSSAWYVMDGFIPATLEIYKQIFGFLRLTLGHEIK